LFIWPRWQCWRSIYFFGEYDMTMYILLEEGDFVGAYSSRAKAEESALANDIRNWHIIETTLRN
jgi:hypothetical protein